MTVCPASLEAGAAMRRSQRRAGGRGGIGAAPAAMGAMCRCRNAGRAVRRSRCPGVAGVNPIQSITQPAASAAALRPGVVRRAGADVSPAAGGRRRRRIGSTSVPAAPVAGPRRRRGDGGTGAPGGAGGAARVWAAARWAAVTAAMAARVRRAPAQRGAGTGITGVAPWRRW
ncbi:hypothetical protein BZL29_8517 [Mycobacterium kansasii]|uniref:Uncharacterized protein n=1 Tax=Mycobacterium kansasii TaxID=1768 RepID=A0A1V3W937_MYCKA|nr:hypothetical protein BZL29_8517 [Mycobacterium kansasii]